MSFSFDVAREKSERTKEHATRTAGDVSPRLREGERDRKKLFSDSKTNQKSRRSLIIKSDLERKQKETSDALFLFDLRLVQSHDRVRAVRPAVDAVLFLQQRFIFRLGRVDGSRSEDDERRTTRDTVARENTSSSSNEASSREKKNFFASSSSSLLHQSVVQKVLVVSLSLGPKALLFSPGGVSYALIKRERVRESFFSEESGEDWIGDVIQKKGGAKRSKKKEAGGKKKEGKKSEKKKKKEKKKATQKKTSPSFFFFFFFVVVYVVSLSKRKKPSRRTRRGGGGEKKKRGGHRILRYIYFFSLLLLLLLLLSRREREAERGGFSNSCFLVFCIGTTSRARVCVCAYINDAGKMRVELEDIALRHPTIRFLLEKLEESGCAIDKRFFHVEECHKQVVGGFVPGKGISLCYNQIQTRTEMENMLAHELIHAYDDCARRNMNWMDLKHHACSEVRAANLSGDCHWYVSIDF